MSELTPQESAARAVHLISQLAELSPRVHASIIPSSWTDDQAKRLTRVVDKVLEAGEAGLRTVEEAISG